MIDNFTSDEYGVLNVYSEARLKKLKNDANSKYKEMSEVVLKINNCITGLSEFAKVAESTAKSFHSISKEYVEVLKAIENENIKVTF